MSQRWRGASDNEGQSLGSACTVRSGAGRYGVEGSPGTIMRIDGELHCVADDRASDIRSDSHSDHRDHKQTMDQIYNQIDAERSQAWRQR
jgi:hypothetical protein